MATSEDLFTRSPFLDNVRIAIQDESWIGAGAKQLQVRLAGLPAVSAIRTRGTVDVPLTIPSDLRLCS